MCLCCVINCERFHIKKDLAKCFQKRLLFGFHPPSPFLPIQSREDEPVGHGSAISASISSHAEHFLSPLGACEHKRILVLGLNVLDFVLTLARCLFFPLWALANRHVSRTVVAL